MMMVPRRNGQTSFRQLDFPNEVTVDLDYEKQVEHLSRYVKKRWSLQKTICENLNYEFHDNDI